MKATSYIMAAAIAVMTLASCSSNEKNNEAEAASDTENAADETSTAVENDLGIKLEEIANAENTAAPDGTVIVIDENDPTTLPGSDYPWVMDFNATWCGPCQGFAPIFHEVAKDYAGKAYFVSIDTDKNPGLSEKFNVTGIPYVVVLNPDGTSKTNMGYIDESQFREFLQK